MEQLDDNLLQEQPVAYDDDSIKTLNWNEHIRLRPGMYIGRLGDGSQAEDGVYVLLKEVIDNSIDEFMMGCGKVIKVDIKEGYVSVRDYGRGIPLSKLVAASSKMNTGAKYDSKTFHKSVGLNGVGIKAVNALSSYFRIQSFRENQTLVAEFEKGVLLKESPIEASTEASGTLVE
ncbi:MAG: ATP-binding protein, partial [Bacteroidales bacterium]|nr:ATP-binding protein [Bacteroidales bacterium]